MQQGEITQGEQTKQNIVAALVQSLRSVTYQQVKVGDLMRRATIGRSTFYRHFSSKLDVLYHSILTLSHLCPVSLA
ncbi:TetR/AcrR family transcriptional regulator [Shewanella halifaxensis]|uniref:TetR/AcrR family transcriptional regulator n=1 Tax=Shewanella halifaxensis TaxID=271098 RepID=UPI000D590EB8